jgi:hypothetical protein
MVFNGVEIENLQVEGKSLKRQSYGRSSQLEFGVNDFFIFCGSSNLFLFGKDREHWLFGFLSLHGVVS